MSLAANGRGSTPEDLVVTRSEPTPAGEMRRSLHHSGLHIALDLRSASAVPLTRTVRRAVAHLAFVTSTETPHAHGTPPILPVSTAADAQVSSERLPKPAVCNALLGQVLGKSPALPCLTSIQGLCTCRVWQIRACMKPVCCSGSVRASCATMRVNLQLSAPCTRCPQHLGDQKRCARAPGVSRCEALSCGRARNVVVCTACC